MNTFRYVIAAMLIVAIPAAILYWFLIHPFVRFWRRLGTGLSYTVICALLAGVMTCLYLMREPLMGKDRGFSPLCALIGLACVVVSILMKLKISKELPVRVLVGVPELLPNPSEGRVLDQGIYARIRHPRYVQMDFALAGFALIVNYSGTYLFLLLWFIGIYLVVLLEERELLARFGNDYRDYCRRTPRFIPRLGQRK